MSNGRNIRLRGRLHDYTVGYGKPPKKNRFKKGDSGNPGASAIKCWWLPRNPLVC